MFFNWHWKRNFILYDNFDDIKHFLDKKHISNLDNYENNVIDKVNSFDFKNNTEYLFMYGDWYEKLIDGEKVLYKINSNGFRSDHFEALDNNNINILYGGCSLTFGMGVPYEYTWPKILYENIKTLYTDKTVKYYNTGFMGSSIDLVIKNVMAFIRTYGKPDYLILCLPDIARQVQFFTKNNEYTKAGASMYNLLNDIKDNHPKKEYTMSYKYENALLLATNLIRMLEDYCCEAGIKLFWSTWFDPDIELYKKLDFNNFIETLYKNKIGKTEYPNIKNLPYWEVGEDNGHPGTCWTTYIAEKYFEEIKRDYYN